MAIGTRTKLLQSSSGDVAGVGVSLSVDAGRNLPLIVGVESGTPAAEAGLQVQYKLAGRCYCLYLFFTDLAVLAGEISWDNAAAVSSTLRERPFSTLWCVSNSGTLYCFGDVFSYVQKACHTLAGKFAGKI